MAFTALDDGRGGIELEVRIEAAFRALPAVQRSELYGRWMDSLRARAESPATGAEERLGLELLLDVVAGLRPLLEQEQRPPPAVTLSVSGVAATVVTAAATPPRKH